MEFLWERLPILIAFLCHGAEVWGAGRHRSPIMFDVIYLLLGLGGFAACLGFVRLCELL